VIVTRGFCSAIAPRIVRAAAQFKAGLRSRGDAAAGRARDAIRIRYIMEPKYRAKPSAPKDGPALFIVRGFSVARLGIDDAPLLQRLLERCGDYYEMVEGRQAEPNAAVSELTDGPVERVPHDLYCLGILDPGGSLAGTIGALRNHRRPRQWYLGLMLLDPAVRNQGLGASLYRSFEDWIIGQGADSILLAVVEKNVRAARFWVSVGFAWPRCYPERTIGIRRHVLIEYDKRLRPEG
jgi:GNAT superfamily N-acetyltransferase